MVEPARLKAFLDEEGVRYGQNSVSYVLNCPRCLKSKKLYISKRSGRFVCFYCKEISNFQGRPEFALAELTNLGLDEIRGRLYGDRVSDLSIDLHALGIASDEFFGPDDPRETESEEFTPRYWPAEYLAIDHPHSQKGVDYLAGRGIDLALAVQYQLKYAPTKRRIAFPIHFRGQLIGWQERLIVPNRWFDEATNRTIEVPKILSSPGIPRDRVLMFGHRLVDSPHAVLAEGPVDAIKAHLCGGNVATMGKAVAPKQVRRLREAGIRKLYLALDPDAAEETRRLAYELADLECYSMVPPAPYKDLGEMPLEAVLETFRGAKRIRRGTVFVFLR